MSNKQEEKVSTKKGRPKIYIVGGGFEYIRLMYNLRCDGAKGVEDADVVLFTGGEDVNPELYGEKALERTNFNRLRDEKEKAIYHIALERGIPMVGICRGGQFLNVMNKGQMWQHVTNHCVKSHPMKIEVPPFNENGKSRVIDVTSTHHQMMIPTDEAIIIGTACEAYEKQKPGYAATGTPRWEDPDIEVVFYDDTNCLCFQPHPEFTSAPPECVDFFEECLENWIFPRIGGLNETGKAIIDQIPKAITKKEKLSVKEKTK